MNDKKRVPAGDDFRLSKRVTLGRLRKALDSDTANHRDALVRFVYSRLIGRYIRPLLRVPGRFKSGFLMMASCCLLIETLESFRQGWPETNAFIHPKQLPPGNAWPDNRMQIKKSEVAFHWFFQKHSAFRSLQPHARGFYVNVRCGILHQGETTSGWRVRRDNSPIFDPGGLAVNANVFLESTCEAVKDYRAELQQAPWASVLWQNLRNKVQAILDNCGRSA